MECPVCAKSKKVTLIHPYGDGYGFCPRCDLDFVDDRIKGDDPVDESELQ